MTRRAAWSLGAIALALLLAGIAVWWWQSSLEDPAPAASRSPTSVATDADVQQLAQQQLDDHLGSCIEDAVGAVLPEGCGLRIPWGTEFAAVDRVRMRIDRLPTLELTDEGFVAEDGVLVVTVTGTGQNGSARTETYRTDSWSVRGDVTRDGTNVALDVW
ncbi:hypothetical protein [Microbacterium foliorum]|uniref:hypothetical protein n=1 Tax=Microbacterium foliorum TaxID=104336 RepID=UPI0028D46203|nr:hypothetical protein [Microbacterium foliorum]